MVLCNIAFHDECNAYFASYINTDFVFLSSLRDRGLDRVNLTYDIICQWSINLMRRISAFPRDLTAHMDQLTLYLLMDRNVGPYFRLIFSVDGKGLMGRLSQCWSERGTNHLYHGPVVRSFDRTTS